MNSDQIESLWAHLHWLTVLADQGSYTGAAGRLGVSKAAVSLKIAELERAAGVPLVQRTTRSVRLTEAGLRLVDETRPLYERIAQSFSGVRDTAEVVRGSLRVSAPVALARQHLAPRLAEFSRRHPEARVQLDVSDRLVSLATEGFDLAIRHSAAAPDTHVAWTLCRTVSVLVATPGYLARRGTPARPEDLVGHDCLYYPRSHGSAAWSFERAGARRARAARIAAPVTTPIAGPLCANNSEVLRDAALDDLGIALLPDFSAVAALRAGTLVRVLPEWRPVGVFAEQLLAVRPYATQVPRVVTAFVAYLREAFAPGFGVDGAGEAKGARRAASKA
ncbi:LysR family transcriptional regulator [Burkholderia sp. Ac-20379]|uniref:LysR family transcriptional regulator n=1 Tax=Burkholderia sp. Ac-20379 TaxID=2703900 RepID=UPI00197D6FB9|nr:LysR family transcriptional regulator [Burkholderia sp. Ac-20379]MBN3727801.1 LysR family transcriptional regulator [Burkholderia sp. Ac-20379]